jgi:hypothetical protein
MLSNSSIQTNALKDSGVAQGKTGAGPRHSPHRTREAGLRTAVARSVTHSTSPTATLRSRSCSSKANQARGSPCARYLEHVNHQASLSPIGQQLAPDRLTQPLGDRARAAIEAVPRAPQRRLGHQGLRQGQRQASGHMAGVRHRMAWRFGCSSMTTRWSASGRPSMHTWLPMTSTTRSSDRRFT